MGDESDAPSPSKNNGDVSCIPLALNAIYNPLEINQVPLDEM